MIFRNILYFICKFNHHALHTLNDAFRRISKPKEAPFCETSKRRRFRGLNLNLHFQKALKPNSFPSVHKRKTETLKKLVKPLSFSVSRSSSIPRNQVKMSLRVLNPNAEVLNKSAALHMNINAAKGLQDVLKTNLGPKGTIKMYTFFSLFLFFFFFKFIPSLSLSFFFFFPFSMSFVSHFHFQACWRSWRHQTHQGWQHSLERDGQLSL